MDSIDHLIYGAVQDEILQCKNPYLTMETIVLRLYRKIADRTQVSINFIEKTILFSNFHDEILTIYQSLQSGMSHDEKIVIERVLSKDTPHPNELIKFANCMYKYDPASVCRWFAVDGIISTHPKSYVHEAFASSFEQHNQAVRKLYDYIYEPEKIKKVVEKALLLNDDELVDSDLQMCVGLYSDMVGKDTLKRMADERRSKLEPKKCKKRTFEPSSPQNVD